MITNFLKLPISKEEVQTALDVLRKFKSCESGLEWAAISFQSWAKLEQFEEFLDHLATGAALKEDTIEYMKQALRS